MIRSQVAYTWDLKTDTSDTFTKIKNLYTKDTTLIKRIQMVQTSLLDLFEDTIPNQPLLGDKTFQMKEIEAW